MAEAPHHLAIREQLNEQREALADLDALLQSSEDDNGEIQEVRDQLYEAVQELEAMLADADAPAQEPDLEGAEEEASHAGLGFRDASVGASNDGSDEDEEYDEEEEEEDIGDAAEETASDSAVPSRATLAMAADAEAVAQAARAGPQTETIHFATWEAHTRGVGSKLMAAMGYRKGTGLGLRRDGSAAPIEVQMLRKGAGLGVEALSRKLRKSSRGGERSRRRKLADAARAAREAERDSQTQLEIEAGQPGLFAFINTRLTNGQQPSGQASANSGGNSKDSSTSGKKEKTEHKQMDRRALAAQQDEVAVVRDKLARLKQMAARNANDGVISAQVKQKIQALEKELAAAEAVSQHAHRAVHAKEKEKKWLKF